MRYKAPLVGGARPAGRKYNQKSRAGNIAIYWSGGPESEHESTFLDTFCDVFSSPEDIDLTSQYPGALWVRIWDAQHIRSYFEKAIADLGAAEPAIAGVSVVGHGVQENQPGEEEYWLGSPEVPHHQFRQVGRTHHR